MQICFNSMCADLNRSLESTHSILRMCSFVSPMGNCLRDLPTFIIFPCKRERSCRKLDVVQSGKMIGDKRCGISIFSCNSGVVSAITAAFVTRNIAPAFTFISRDLISSVNERPPKDQQEYNCYRFVALNEQLDKYQLARKC